MRSSKLNSEEGEDTDLILSIDEGLESGLLTIEETVAFIDRLKAGIAIPGKNPQKNRNKSNLL